MNFFSPASTWKVLHSCW